MAFTKFNMEIDSSTNDVKEQHLPVEETDDSCRFDTVALDRYTDHTDGSCTTECISGDWSAEVKQENVADIEQEPDDVCCAVYCCRQIFLSDYLKCLCLQCSDAVGWAAGRASGL